jgi:ketosteroid isomerase-like protein
VQTPEQLVREFTAIWIAGDIDRAIQYVADDCVYALYLSDELLPFAGEMVGRDAIEGSLREMRRQFDYLVYRPHNWVEQGDVVRHRVEFIYRHRASGEIINGNFRFLITVRDGKFVRGEEYHDRAMVEAFMRYFAAQ